MTEEQSPGPEIQPTQTVNAVIVDFNMPFWSMVLFIVKWSVASVPALILLGFIGMLVFAVFAGFVRAIGSH